MSWLTYIYLLTTVIMAITSIITVRCIIMNRKDEVTYKNVKKIEAMVEVHLLKYEIAF